MKYTISKEADKKIESDLRVIKEILLKKLDLKAMVMFGGFGHGGGSFKKIKGKILPLNDYDIYLITDKQIDGERLEGLGEECSRALGRGGIEIVENFNEEYDENKFFHVDLHCLTLNKLKKMPPTQRTFDLKNSIVVHGKKDILNQIPLVKISKSDSIRLLFNKLNHFAIAEKNSEIIQSIYAVKGFTDLCSALLIFEEKYVSGYEEREKIFAKTDFPNELKKFVKMATEAKLKKGYEVANTEEFFKQSKKWVEWTLKRIIRKHLRIKSEDWKRICSKMYRKLPYIYFNDYLGTRFLFFAQYYLNWKFFLEGLRKKEFFLKTLTRWRDPGLILGIAMMLYSFGELKESEKYIKKISNKTKPLKQRLLKLYSIYYLQKLV